MPIYQKIQQVMKRVHGVEKTSENKHGKFKYAGHEAVTAALRDVFVEVGIVREIDVVEHAAIAGVVHMLVRVRHVDVEDGTFTECRMFAVQPTQTSGGAFTAQQPGQALSYAVKCVEFKLFALTGDPEPDSDSTESTESRDDESWRSKVEQPTTANNGPRSRADALLKAFDVAADQEAIDAASAALRASWKELKGVAGLAEEVPKRREAAQKRLKAQRQPGEEG